MAASLQFVEIPGFRDACKREAAVRRAAWCHAHTQIAGVRVRLLTLRDMVLLEEMGNGFFNPWRFDSDEEFFGHCAQLVWWLSDCPKPKTSETRWLQPKVAYMRTRLLRFLSDRPQQLAADVRQYLEDSFLDAPKGAAGNGQPIAAAPAYIMDTLAAGGYAMPQDEVLDMPVTRLWQLLRVAARRVFGMPATNYSDQLACEYLAQLNQGEN